MKKKYNAIIYNIEKQEKKSIGQVSSNSILDLKKRARIYARNYNLKGGRIFLEDQNSGSYWTLNS